MSSRRVGGRFLAFATVASAVLLIAIYGGVGDRTLWGEWVSIWPPLFWFAALLPAVLLVWACRLRKEGLFALGAAVGFLIATTEWPPLLRSEDPDLRQRFDALRRSTRGGGFALRVVVWNVARKLPLDELASYEADIYFLQESPPADLKVNGGGDRKGFYWARSRDPAVLSRFPLEVLDGEPVGPSSRPQILVAHLPGERRVLLVNVHLMHTSVVLKLFNPSDRTPARDYRVRMEQIPRLARLVDRVRREQAVRPAIVAGDFNVPGRMPSLAPLARDFSDVWTIGGIGWGGTVPASWPVARIDHCWVSGDFRVVSARVGARAQSDHRPLIVDLILQR